VEKQISDERMALMKFCCESEEADEFRDKGCWSVIIFPFYDSDSYEITHASIVESSDSAINGNFSLCDKGNAIPTTNHVSDLVYEKFRDSVALSVSNLTSQLFCEH